MNRPTITQVDPRCIAFGFRVPDIQWWSFDHVEDCECEAEPTDWREIPLGAVVRLTERQWKPVALVSNFHKVPSKSGGEWQPEVWR